MIKCFGSVVRIFFNPLSFRVELTDHIVGARSRELELQAWNVRSKYMKTKVTCQLRYSDFLQRLNIPKWLCVH
jgi:hypothetical protein